MSSGYIHTALSLKHDCIYWNGEIDSLLAPSRLEPQLDAIYKKKIKDYPKYYRMDTMAKLVFILGELLCDETGICEEVEPDDIAIILYNSSGSYPSDLKHFESIKDGIEGASPANFVYTLPNVGVGELCIKRQITGENLFLIADSMDYHQICDMASMYLEQRRCKAVIIGWTEPTQNDGNHLLLITEKSGGLELPNQVEYLRKLLE